MAVQTKEGNAKVQYSLFRRALIGARLPGLVLDLAGFEFNAQHLLASSNNFPIRIATKSIRSTSILKKILAFSPRFKGLMAYSAAEAAYLAAQGFDDILIGYPTVERQDLEAAIGQCKLGKKIIFMVCAKEQVDALRGLAKHMRIAIDVCIDLDQSTPFPGLYFGVHRSSLKTPREVLEFVNYVASDINLRFVGFMGYDAQIAGVPDNKPFQVIENHIVRLLKALAMKRIRRERRETCDYLTAHGIKWDLFNGAGTGSLKASQDDRSLTELTAGSGFYGPALFDGYFDLSLRPALFFVLPVTRKNGNKWITCHGGGYIASGSAGKDRLPTPIFPNKLKLFSLEGAGEVQTPLRGDIAEIKIGDPIFFKHAKAGELCEHFNDITIVKDGQIMETVQTYRGAGLSFL